MCLEIFDVHIEQRKLALPLNTQYLYLQFKSPALMTMCIRLIFR